MKRSEIAYLLVVLVLLGAAVFAGDKIPSAPTEQRASTGAFTSAGWYCITPPGETAQATVASVNVGDDPVRLRASVIGEGKHSDPTEADLPARRLNLLGLAGFGIGSGTGLIETFGEATSAHIFAASQGSGVASSRCTVQPASRWLIPAVSTARGQDHFLMLSNPFEEEAVVRVRMIAPDRDLVPARLKDLVVPPLTQLAVALVDYIPETASFGLDVTATQGRIVAGAFSRFASRDGQKGTALVLGAREPQPIWYLPSGGVPADGEEYLAVINPGDKEALVQAIFHEEGAQLAPESLHEVPVPAGRQVMIKVSDHVARGNAHGSSVSTTNEVPIVVERLVLAGKAFDAEIGATTSGTRWAVAMGAPVQGSESLAIINPGRTRSTMNIKLVTDKGEVRPIELSGITVEAGRRVTIDMTQFLGGGIATAVIETITGDVVPERRFTAGDPFWDFTETVGQALERG